MNLALNKIVIDQVCPPSLQIILGIYLNLYILFEKFGCDIDLRIMDLYICKANNGFGEHEENKNTPFYARANLRSDTELLIELVVGDR